MQNTYCIRSKLVVILKVNVHGDALLLEGLLNQWKVGHDKAHQIRLVAVAVDKNLQYIRTLRVNVLNLRRSNVFALSQFKNILVFCGSDKSSAH